VDAPDHGEPELLGDEPVRLPRVRREVDEAGRQELWRPPRWLVVAMVLTIVASLVAGGAWYADRRARAHETEALDGCLRELHNALISSDLQMMSAATTIRPVVASAEGRVRRALLRHMSGSARLVLPQVVRADASCRSVSIRAWHFSLRARRGAATDYATALAARLREIAADGATYYRDESALRRLRRTAGLGVFGGRY
jgi:hypothetical protein